MIKRDSPCAEAFAEFMTGAVTSTKDFLDYLTGGRADAPYVKNPKMLDWQETSDFGDAIFRLYDDDGVTAAAINEFLRLKWFAGVALIVSRSLLTRNYGNYRYTGVRYPYSAEERYFDRFIEMVRFFKIPEESLLPLLVHAQSYGRSDGSERWARPAEEYLTATCEKGIEPVLEKIFTLPDRAGALEGLCKINETNVIEAAVRALLTSPDANRQELRTLLSSHKRLALDYAAPYLEDGSISVREGAVRVMLLFRQDEKVRKTLLSVRDNEKSTKIKNLINSECGADTAAKGFKNIAELEAAARDSKLRGGERGLSLELFAKNGEKLSRAAVSYILGVLGSKTVPPVQKAALYSLKPLLNTAMLGETCAALAGREDAADKAGVSAFVFLFGAHDDAHKLLLVADLHAIPPAKRKLFLNSCAISRLPVCRKYLNILSSDRKFASACRDALAIVAAVTGRAADDVREEFQEDFGLGKDGKYVYNTESGAYFKDDLSVELYGSPNIRLTAWSKRLLKAVEVCSKRFEESFLARRRWQSNIFTENILGNNFLKIIASTLFWGEYKENKLERIFVIDGAPKNLAGESITLDGECRIGLVHPIELDKSAQFIKTITSRQAFNQMRRDIYFLKEFEIAHNCISRFKGSIVKKEIFLQNLAACGFAPEKDNASAIKIINDYLIKIDYSQILIQGYASVSIGEARLFSASNTPKFKGKFATDKSYALSMRILPEQLISDVIYDLSLIVKQ